MSNWSPQQYLSEAKNLGCGEKFLGELRKESGSQRNKNLPILFGLKHLAILSDSNHKILHARMHSSEGLYRIFNIRKRSGGYRQITVPCPSLRIAQSWINDNLLSHRKPHSASTAYARGSSPLENARRHCAAKWLIKLDITDFFESISEKQVFHVFRDIGYKDYLSFQLARICTRTSDSPSKYLQHPKRWISIIRMNGQKIKNRIGHLPQGAPTSPMLSNLVCFVLDVRLQELADKYGCNYSRYADDITFSANDLNRNQVSEIIILANKEIGKLGFRRNRRKTQVSPPGARKVVTGLLVDSREPRLTKSFKERITTHLYYSKRFTPQGHCQKIGFSSLPSFMDHLNGLITYAEHVDRAFGQACREKFDALDWEYIRDIAIYIK